MTSKLKTLWVVPLTALALCAVLVPGASAGFESEAEVTTLSVSSNAMQSFKTSAGSSTTIECTTVAVDAVVEGSTWHEMPTKPTYSSCEKFLGISVEIDENDCEYTFSAGASSTSGSVDLECPSATGIEITVGSTCRYEIDSQTNLGTVTYINKGASSTREIEIQPSVTGITSTRTTSDFPFACPAGSSTGTYTGNSTITGSSASGHVGIFVD